MTVKIYAMQYIMTQYILIYVNDKNNKENL